MKGMLLMALLLFCAFLTGCSLLDIKDGGQGMTNPDYVEPEKDEIDEENSEKAQYEKDPHEKYRFEKNQHEKIRMKRRSLKRIRQLPGCQSLEDRHWQRSRKVSEITGQF